MNKIKLLVCYGSNERQMKSNNFTLQTDFFLTIASLFNLEMSLIYTLNKKTSKAYAKWGIISHLRTIEALQS